MDQKMVKEYTNFWIVLLTKVISSKTCFKEKVF